VRDDLLVHTSIRSPELYISARENTWKVKLRPLLSYKEQIPIRAFNATGHTGELCIINDEELTPCSCKMGLAKFMMAVAVVDVGCDDMNNDGEEEE